MNRVVVVRRSCVLVLILMAAQTLCSMEPTIEFYAEASRLNVNLPSDDRTESELACRVGGVDVGTNGARDKIRGQSSGFHHEKLALDVKNNFCNKNRSFPISNFEPSSKIPSLTKPLSERAPQGLCLTETEKIEMIQEIQQRCWVLCEGIERFKKESSNLEELSPGNGQQFKAHISNWESTAHSMYRSELKQLAGGRDLAKQIYVVNRELFRKAVAEHLSSLNDVIYASFYREKDKNDRARLLMARWSDFTMDFFLDLMDRKIFKLSSPDVMTSQFVSSYLLGKFPPFDVPTTYLNFYVRESILRDRNAIQLRELSQQFNEATWK
ncbi:hypothetical protein PCANC_06624 [Puccinia coronata f. sp. avenae]|uniref:Cullin N-terminal domain-containing protein n=1 Tax=Puccinia coronata f. sp. avenae TaxID=200324 RepID=A0A2N5SZZ2_9BASI|nr:hypothetical protein PCANC_06624 [Puccinia coronata f. sp. avenae]PLW33685.1 hypothetical protein PCASD_10293 [Puccinia coronata f. sp. avenae]